MATTTHLRRAAAVAAALAALLPAADAAAYGWPVKPFDRQHPVRGFFGDPRIGHTDRGKLESFHFGIDISAPDGTPVYAVRSGVADTNKHEVVIVRSGAGKAFEYWHVVPAVKTGQRVIAFRTVLGRVARGWGHVHLGEWRHGRFVNPLRRGGIEPFVDRTKPEVRTFSFERAGAAIGRSNLSGRLDLVAEAVDETPLAVPAPWNAKPVTPVLVRWRLVGRRATTSWRVAADFRRTIPDASRFHAVYAKWTRQNKPWRYGRYRFVLAAGWDSSSVQDGVYRLEVEAADTRGNRARRSTTFTIRNEPKLEGRDLQARVAGRPAVAAAFTAESYSPGAVARLVVADHASGVAVQLFRAGTERSAIGPRDEMRGTPVTRIRAIGNVAGRRAVRLRIGTWPSGLYYARLTAPGGRIGYAPFVLRPRRLGESPVAVVLPTFTWQSYNFRDDDGDGDADTWYDGPDERSVRLGRPYENRGVPPHYKHYDQPFLRWLHTTGRQVDFLSDTDLNATTGSALARAYELVVFPGHHEYVTASEYDAVEEFRDRGGNLVFLSANNFFWRVDLRGSAIWRVAKWRDLGRPEAALVGVQYVGNDEGESRGAWIVRRDGASSWIFRGTGVRVGSEFSNGGIEVDKTAPSSPPGTRILAEIPDLFGPGMHGQMTYYETPRGAKVFAAGAFTLAGSIRQPTVRQLVANLFHRLGSVHDPGGRP